MRLREPLYGWRIANMHVIVHLSLLLNQFLYIDMDAWDLDIQSFTENNINKFKKIEENEENLIPAESDLLQIESVRMLKEENDKLKNDIMKIENIL